MIPRGLVKPFLADLSWSLASRFKVLSAVSSTCRSFPYDARRNDDPRLHYSWVMRFSIGFIGARNALERPSVHSFSDNIEYLALGIGEPDYFHRTASAQADLLWPHGQ